MPPKRISNIMTRYFVHTAIILIMLSVPCFSQSADEQNKPLGDYLTSGSNDKNGKTDVFYVDSEPDTTKPRNPTVALFKSLLVPGLGQISNKKYIKAGIIIGLESTLIGTVVHYAKKTSDAKREFDNNSDTDLKASLFKTFDDAKDKRNYYSWLLGTLVFISMFDAYVDAHLANFPEYEKKISFDFRQTDEDNVRAVITCRF